jgi:asparagine N-glycosylation enzyme membrane subunit Stt3
MLGKMLNSNWFAFLMLAVAAFSLVLLHYNGKTREALIGAGVLVVAAMLIFYGSRSSGR